MGNDRVKTETELLWLPETLDVEEEPEASLAELHSGDLCPQCRSARLDYDGLLNLSCPECGYAVGGCFT